MTHGQKTPSQIAMIATVVLLCMATSCKRDEPVFGLGDEWRSWTNDQRRMYVVGFLAGQSTGFSQACEKMDNLATITKPDPKEPTDSPSSRCRHEREEYSKRQLVYPDPTTLKGASVDVATYTTVLDTFYQHPECRAMPYVVLLSHLNDKEFKSGEELFSFVRSGPGWGAFTIDGMDKCLPQHEEPANGGGRAQ